MRKFAFPFVGFSIVAALAATPAFAVEAAPVPEPEVAGGLLAMGMLGLGYRLLRRRFMR